MTLVASFSVYGWPIILGDIMISLPYQGKNIKPFNIPTHSDVNARVTLNTSRVVSGLVQKVAILTPQLVIAWAGSSICAKGVFQDVLNLSVSPQYHHVATVLDEWKNERGMDLYVTGICLSDGPDNTTVILRFAWDSDNGWKTGKQMPPNYGACYAGGTGKDPILNLLSNTILTSSTEQAPALDSAICHALAHIGKLSGDQMLLGLGIKNFYGGGFEIATLINGQLQKVGDVAYHFWEAKRAPDSQITVTFHASLKIIYFEDYLVIRKIDYVNEIPNINGVDELYIIGPVCRRVSEIEKTRLLSSVPRPSLNARFNVFYVHFPEVRGENHAYVGAHKSGTPGESKMIKFNEENSELQIEINYVLFEYIKNELNKRTDPDGSVLASQHNPSSLL